MTRTVVGGTTDMEFAFIGTHTAADWADWYQTNAAVTEGDVVVATDPYPWYVAPDRIGEDPQGFDAVDVAVDDCGIAYILATDGDVYRYDPNLDRLTRLACVWDPDDESVPAAIAVTDDSIYVADTETGRVQALSVHLLQTRWIADEFEDPVGFTTSCETVYVLDKGDLDPATTEDEGRVVRLGPGGETETVVQELNDPVDIASDTAGNVYVLGKNRAGDPVIELFEAAVLTTVDETGATAHVRVPSEAFTVTGTGEPLDPSCLEAIGEGEIIVGVGPEASGEKTLFRYRPLLGDGALDRGFERIPSYSGSSKALQLGQAAHPGDDPSLYVVEGGEEETTADTTENTVYHLDSARRTLRNDDTGRYDAQVATRFDSGELETEWHRVTAGLNLNDSRTQVRLAYAATDDDWLPASPDAEPAAVPSEAHGFGDAYTERLAEAGITQLGELVELTPGELGVILGTEGQSITLLRAATLLDQARDAIGSSPDLSRIDWRGLGHPNPQDALLDDAEGRYLWVKVEFVGSEFSSPRIDHFQAYFPRQSYLRYLPAVYQEDEQSAGFLERYLSLFESTFEDIEEDIESSSKYLDPEGIPSDHLLWLASWLAAEADDTWSAAAVRKLIQRAPELYKKRGTAEGLLEMVRIYLSNATATDIGRIRRTAGRGREPLAGSGPTDGGPVTSSPARGATTGTERTGVRTGMGTETKTTGGVWEAGSNLVAEEDREADAIEEGDDATAAEPRSVFLLEHGDLSCVKTAELRELYSRLISCPQGFLVLFDPDVDEEFFRTVERIVDTQQPAHAIGQAVHLRPWLMLNGEGKEADGDDDGNADGIGGTERGFHTYLGINSRLSTREFRLDEVGLGQDTMLVEQEEYGHLELQSRLGRDARIN